MQNSNRRTLARIATVAALTMVGVLAFAQDDGPPQPWSKWKVHDMSRPMAPVVTPGTPSTQERPGKAPSDAIVLFDGTSLDNFVAINGSPNPWKLEDGSMVTAKSDIKTKQEFGDVQVHVEWCEPTPVKGNSQARGNSGVFLMGRFEIQVLDNFQNPTYADGACSGVYGQYPPQVNACLPPGQWQTYDIIFHHPRFKDGKLDEPAYVTVLQNGVLTQDHQRIEGPTKHMHIAQYSDTAEKGPLQLQFHHDPVRYRNIWIRPLEAVEHQQQTGEVAEK